MTTEYSSPYKVGLIDVGTKFAQADSLVCDSVRQIEFSRHLCRKFLVHS